jgi:hypothetical protein
MVQLTALVSIAFLACGISALPQSAPPNATALSSDAAPSGTLPKSVIDSLPIIPVAGDTSGTVVQASNSSLVQARPDIVAAPKSTLPSVPTGTVSVNFLCYWSHTEV